MTRDEYLAVLATEPATPNQRGAIMAEFERLGFGGDDRAERLAICAGLLGLAGLGSTGDLVMGQAGQLVAILRRIRDRAELLSLATVAGAGGQAGEHPPAGDAQAGGGRAGNEPVTLAAAIRRIALMICIAFHPEDSAAKQDRRGEGMPDDGS